jgi:hypothetical protein
VKACGVAWEGGKLPVKGRLGKGIEAGTGMKLPKADCHDKIVTSS